MIIHYEDDMVLAITKPSGVVVNRAASVKGQTIQDWAEEQFVKPYARSHDMSSDDARWFIERGGIVHRLDKETSGILLVAKTPEGLLGLQRQFKERTTKKEYLALVHRLVEPPEGEIIAPVGRLPWNRVRFGVTTGGRDSHTIYQVRKRYVDSKKKRYSLVQVSPVTGRTHQIRVHFQYNRHPVVGDQLYAGRKQSRADRLWCPRLFLHAHSIRFVTPATGESIIARSELPDDLHQVLQRLQEVKD
jgi:23S rRNA pseudouridine1911/1915/1917 synthase